MLEESKKRLHTGMLLDVDHVFQLQWLAQSDVVLSQDAEVIRAAFDQIGNRILTLGQVVT